MQESPPFFVAQIFRINSDLEDERNFAEAEKGTRLSGLKMHSSSPGRSIFY